MIIVKMQNTFDIRQKTQQSKNAAAAFFDASTKRPQISSKMKNEYFKSNILKKQNKIFFTFACFILFVCLMYTVHQYVSK